MRALAATRRLSTGPARRQRRGLTRLFVAAVRAVPVVVRDGRQPQAVDAVRASAPTIAQHERRLVVLSTLGAHHAVLRGREHEWGAFFQRSTGLETRNAFLVAADDPIQALNFDLWEEGLGDCSGRLVPLQSRVPDELLVLGIDLEGRWSAEAWTFVRLIAWTRAEAQDE